MNSKKAKGYMDCGMLDSMLSTLITKDQSLMEIAQFFYHQGYMDCHATNTANDIIQQLKEQNKILKSIDNHLDKLVRRPIK